MNYYTTILPAPSPIGTTADGGQNQDAPAHNGENGDAGSKTVTGPGAVTVAGDSGSPDAMDRAGQAQPGASQMPTPNAKPCVAGPVNKSQAKSDKRKSRQASQKAPLERLTKAGGIRIENEELLRSVPLYCTAKGEWYASDGHGGFAIMSDAQAKTLLAEYGFNKNAKDGQGNTPAERAMIWIKQNNRVAFAGSLAGYPAGVYEAGGIRFLVTETQSFVAPKPDKCDTIRTLIESLLLDADAAPEEPRRQIVCFYLWASESLKEFNRRVADGVTDKFRHCPALAIFGPRGCGKSALIDLVLTPLLGGRKADPMNYLREPKFNKDLFAASLLTLDDKGASANLAERRQRGEGIKDLIWKPEKRWEGKNADVVNLRPFWRLVIAGNDDDAGLQVCPALSKSLEDKLLILRAQQAEGLPATHEENDEWAARIHSELPAFAAFLLAWQPPDGLTLDKRTRIVNFWHPQIATALRELQPEIKLIELIDTLGLIDSEAVLWEGTATQFEQAIKSKDSGGLLDRMFAASNSAGRMLSELARTVPSRVIKTDRQGVSHYRILREK